MSFLGRQIFRVYVSFRECQPKKILKSKSLARLSTVHLETSPVHLHLCACSLKDMVAPQFSDIFFGKPPKKYSYSKNSWWRYPSFACCGATSDLFKDFFSIAKQKCSLSPSPAPFTQLFLCFRWHEPCPCTLPPFQGR